MATEELDYVERAVAETASKASWPQLPVMRSEVYDRIDIDCWGRLTDVQMVLLADVIDARFKREGKLWDVWTDSQRGKVHVADREIETE